MTPPLDRRLSVAPMMEWTDRHCRVFLRAITRRTLLYTEMVHSGAVLRGNTARHLGHDPVEHPLALQLGGSRPQDLAAAAKQGAEFGFDEVNLNVGCPSERAGAGQFGACLMAEPELVRDCVAAMAGAVDIPVTVKSRIGIDDEDTWEALARFVETVAAGGCKTFILHARKALLSGLSPKQNREIPALNYDFVRRIKADFPRLEIILNGGVSSLEAALDHAKKVDGVMVGRAACQDPWMLHRADALFFGSGDGPASRHAVIDAMMPYLEAQCGAGVPLRRITRHMSGLFNGVPGARAWRRHLGENASRKGAGPDTVRAAAAMVAEDSGELRLAAPAGLWSPAPN